MDLKLDLKDVKDQMSQLNKSVSILSRNQAIEWAISNSSIGSFDYIAKANYAWAKSSDLVNQILMSFRKGQSHLLISAHRAL